MKNIVITGAGGVLCSAFAKALASDGNKIALLDLNVEAAAKVAEEITAAGGFAKAYKSNVLDQDELKAIHEQILADFGKCDVLINGAGGNSPKCTTTHEEFELGDEEAEDISTFFNLDKEGFRFVFDLNLLGTLLPTQVFAKDMIGKSYATIINISSMNSYKPLTKIPAYSAAKAAISNFTQFMAVHFSEVGLRVNAIAPGFFSTNQNKALLYNEDGSLTPRSEKILGHTPLGRFGVPEDLTGALLFLADDNYSKFVTGVIIPVDGGFSAYSGV